jgi:hypothetical protein
MIKDSKSNFQKKHDISLPHIVQTGSGVHMHFYLMKTKCSSLGGRRVVA